MARFRHAVRYLLPSWMTAGAGGRVHHALSLMCDLFVARTRAGLEARLPSRSGASALALTGADRGIQRGRAETDAHYAARLINWRYPRGHRVRGSAYALIRQVSEYWGGVRAWTVDARGTRDERSAAGVESYEQGTGWTWDTRPASEWSRFWIGIDLSGIATAHPDWGDAKLWGGSIPADGYTIGQLGVVEADVAAMRGLLYGERPWRPAGTLPEWIIVSLDGTDPVPDATWEHWSAQDGSGVQVRTRGAAWRYWAVDPARNVYSGSPALFCAALTLADDATYAGDPASFPATIDLPDGSTYAGDPASYPASVQLADDGDVPR